MPVITKIARQKKNVERYNIYLDEKYAFSVDENVLIQFQLTKGKEIEDWSIDEMIFEDEVRKAYNRAIHFLAFRMRSEFEVKKKLLDAEYGEAVVLEAIQKLKKQGFLNDQAFSNALLATQKNSGKKGPRSIKVELQKKGIDKELQEKVLSQYSNEEQLKIAIELAEKIARIEHKKTPLQVKQKIQDALLRKGYSFDIISEAIENISIERDEDDWQNILDTIGETMWRKYSMKHSGGNLRMKVKTALYQKGIPAERINRFIEKKESEEHGD